MKSLELNESIQSSHSSGSEQGRGSQADNADEPTAVDVIFGRGRPFQDHAGNQLMRDIVSRLQGKHQRAPRKEKILIVEQVIAEVKSKGGRFLKQDGDKWVQVSHTVAFDKVSHAFRSYTGKKRREGQFSEPVPRTLSSLSSGSTVSSTIPSTLAQEHQLQSALSSLLPLSSSNGGAMNAPTLIGSSTGGPLHNNPLLANFSTLPTSQFGLPSSLGGMGGGAGYFSNHSSLPGSQQHLFGHNTSAFQQQRDSLQRLTSQIAAISALNANSNSHNSLLMAGAGGGCFGSNNSSSAQQQQHSSNSIDALVRARQRQTEELLILDELLRRQKQQQQSSNNN